MGISDQSDFANLVLLMISSLCLEIIHRTLFSSPLASDYKINKKRTHGDSNPSRWLRRPAGYPSYPMSPYVIVFSFVGRPILLLYSFLLASPYVLSILKRTGTCYVIAMQFLSVLVKNLFMISRLNNKFLLIRFWALWLILHGGTVLLKAIDAFHCIIHPFLEFRSLKGFLCLQ